MGDAERHGGGEPDQAAGARDLGDRVQFGIDPGTQDPLGVDGGGAPGLGQRQAPRGAMEQRGARSAASSRVTAFETVAFENPSSAAARPKDCRSATFAKMAQASKSGSVDMVKSRN
jgi:hypothetical protein